MHSFYEVPAFLGTAVLLAVLLRCRRRLKLPLLLALAPALVLLGGLWGFAEDIIGGKRIQAMLLDAFPVANNPNETTTIYVIGDDVEIGGVYWMLLILSGMIKSIGWLLFGVGLLLFSKRLGRERQRAAYSTSHHHA